MEKILKKVLASEITIEHIFNWLTSDNPYDVIIPDVVQTESTRMEFILHFLSYVGEQCQGVSNSENSCAAELNFQAKFINSEKEGETEVEKFSDTKLSKPNDERQMNVEKEMEKLKLSMTRVEFNNHDNFPVLGKVESPKNEGNVNKKSGRRLTSTPVKAVIEQNECKSPVINTVTRKSCNEAAGANQNFLNIESNSSNPFSTSLTINDSIGNTSFETSSPQWTKNSTFNSSIASNSSMTPCSPISPLYNNDMTLRRQKKNHNRSKDKITTNFLDTNNCIDPQKQLTLADFMVVKVKNSRKKNLKNQLQQSPEENSNLELSSDISPDKNARSRRRIKPTKLNISDNQAIQQHEVFGVVTRPEMKNPQFLEAPASDESSEIVPFKVERELLKIERQRQPKIEKIIEPIQEQKYPVKVKTGPLIVPKLDIIDNKKILDILAELYAGLISKNLVPNPMSQIYLIITILTTQLNSQTEKMTNRSRVETNSTQSDSLEQLKKNMECEELSQDSMLRENSTKNEKMHSSDDSQYLNESHNYVYFATSVLVNLKDILAVLDRTTIKLIAENIFINAFQPELCNYLSQLYDEKFQQSTLFKQSESSMDRSNVCFQIDTDNSENFPNVITFSKFRKQRDTFYEILKTWEDSHLKSGWNFRNALAWKINSMLSMHEDPVNYYHIARLFKSQLLMSSGQIEDPIDHESLSFLKSMKDLNPEKLKQLQERLVTPLSSMGPVPTPKFPGVQEFYHNFLMVSLNPNFNVILQNSFIQEIMELNETQFSCSGLETEETSVDENTKQNYMTCVSSLRLLSKFMGFLVSLPFQSEINNLSSINTQIALRNRVIPSLDLLGCLNNSLTNGRLILTVPWIVQYLAMLDPISFKLPYYQKICEILYCIYRTAHNRLNREAALLISFSIGWLIELPNFPKNLYCGWQIIFNKLKTDNRQVCDRNINTEIIKIDGKIATGHNRSLDGMNIIDVRALLSCCPFLTEFKILLTSGKSNMGNSGNANRHITPVSSQLSQPSSETRARKLELELEEAFFHGQQKSVKNTVDFVSERVASGCVKYICRTMMPVIKEKHFTTVKNLLSKRKRLENSQEDLEIIKKQIFPNVTELVTNDLRERYTDTIPEICTTKTEMAMDSLLAEDLSSAVKNMCTKISIRMSLERVGQWLDSYINDAFSSRELYTESLVFSQKNNDIASAESKIHNKNSPCPTAVITGIRNMIWELIEKSGRWSKLSIENVIDNLIGLKGTLTERNDLVPSVERALYPLSVDFSLHIIVFKRELFTSAVEDMFIEIWKLSNGDQITQLFSGILSPRNIKFFMQTNDELAWKTYGKFIRRLLKEKILTMENFSDQCVAIFRYELPLQTVKKTSDILTEAIEDYKCADEHTQKIKYLIGWIAEMCSSFD